jgi:hypothetical protein
MVNYILLTKSANTLKLKHWSGITINSKLSEVVPVNLSEGILLQVGFKKKGNVLMYNLPHDESDEYQPTIQSWVNSNYFSICRSGISAFSSDAFTNFKTFISL